MKIYLQLSEHICLFSVTLLEGIEAPLTPEVVILFVGMNWNVLDVALQPSKCLLSQVIGLFLKSLLAEQGFQ
jgi:hypothetical protein